MSDIAVRVEGMGKAYRIQHQRARGGYRTLQEDVMALLRRRRRETSGSEEFWALKDVSFEVRQGEVLGIIGRNGAGKSTLLKILSRITRPSTGIAEIHGRVGSLLEVGTGFHPELTGRENIFLNGAILGMSRRDIQRQFDSIVAFAEVEQFLDTPVKRYSSGMYMRLAFAVAAHLEPEILIVDEVLAVGDAEFQKKCLGKMGEVARSGRTVLFVSHNMDAVERLCPTSMWLDNGKVHKHGDTKRIVAEYLLRNVIDANRIIFNPAQALANGMGIYLHRLELSGSKGSPDQISVSSNLRITIEWESINRLYKPRIGFVLQTSDGKDVLTTLDATSWSVNWLEPGIRISTCVIPGNLLNEGEYMIDVGADATNPGNFYGFEASRTGAMLRFSLIDDMTLPSKYYGQEGFRDVRWPGVLLMNLEWNQNTVNRNTILKLD